MNANQRRIIKLARQLLTEAEAPSQGPITVVCVQGHAVTVTTQARPQSQQAAPLPPDIKPGTLKARILAVLTNETQTPKAIARRLGTKCNFYFRSQLQDLADRDPPLARRVTGGYRQLYTG